MPKALRENWGFCRASVYLCWTVLQSLMGHWDWVGKHIPSSKREDMQFRGNQASDNAALSSFFKCVIQRIGSPWTFQTGEAFQGYECRNIPGEKTMEDKMEMWNGLFRSLDPMQGAKRIWRKRWKCPSPAGKEIMTWWGLGKSNARN